MRLFALLALLLLSACNRAEDGRVDAQAYDAFWLWAGVEPQPVLDKAKAIYILAAEIKGGPDGRYVDLRPGIPRVKHAQVWIVYRVETLAWEAKVLPRIRRDMENWKAKGNRIAGIQIDFDAATRGLPGYAAFLKQLRAELPTGTGLSVTGLLDWSSGGDSPALNALAGTVDEVVLQTYQGRHTISGYEAYLRQLERVKLPFKIGLVQHGEWQAPPDLPRNPKFRGYVVFLLNPERS
ncbi:DUF3142 domain-containing protein [Sphingorhabdus pulchriflava]|uniref:DUF3142 domain-containing protein n=1 Tax=Sphingorhabdus pulchriflava TaxID=2292257 RepID=A0A371BEQ4_9SPHN|nr:DUF3142 domain-containing protein [Sphingorhabdus pulchriflava]RDV05997.1 DUF3142 domain-containing protein [Sphingorhabdus pulchriflava]